MSRSVFQPYEVFGVEIAQTQADNHKSNVFMMRLVRNCM